jgi:hypothetical protein
MSAPTPAVWLLIGDTPAGPFDLSAVHDKLATGEVTWDTRACPVGAGAWLPLRQTPGIGPAVVAPPAGPAPGAAQLPVAALLPDGLPAASVAPAGSQATAPTGPAWMRVVGGVVGLAVLAAVAYFLYEAVRPLTPREVFDRFDRAKTAADAKRYATPNFHPVIDAVANSFDEPADDVEYTHDGPAPAEFGGHFVGMRGHLFVPEAGRRVRIDAVVHLLDRDGWKVNDLIYMAADGRRLDPPVSLAAEVRGAGGPAGRAGPAGQATRAWYENKTNQRAAAFGVLAALKAGGLKYALGVLAVVGGGLWALLRRANGTARPA